MFSEITKPIRNNCPDPHKLCTFKILIDDLPAIDDTENPLNQCILLNTYREIFRKQYDCQIHIVCVMKFHDSLLEKSANIRWDIIDKFVPFSENPAIDNFVRTNTSAEKELKEQYRVEFHPYNMVFTKLQKDLEKYL